MALLASELRTPPAREQDWVNLLLGLTLKWGHDPWSLIVEDITRPAFMQPPTVEAGLQPLDKAQATPDSVDMLATAKNHDIKAARIGASEPDNWLMALVTVQTMDGYGGGGGVLAGISRMNSGSGSRPCVGLAARGGWGARVRRDIARLVAMRDQIVADNPGYAAEGGIRLVWLEPWVNASPLTPDRLDPFYVEICRRIRLVNLRGSRTIVARTPAGKMGTRIMPSVRGLTGDPWAPIDRKADKLLTITGSGWDYRRVATILDPEKFKAAPLQVWAPDDGADGISLVMMGMARGNSTTDGYHERTIPIPPRVVSLFGGTADRLGIACRERVQQADRMRSKVLYPALCALAGSEKIGAFTAAFDREVDRTFFPRLFDELGAAGDAARDQRKQWIDELFRIAEAMLRSAETSVPVSRASRHNIVAAARSVLAGAYHRNFLTQVAA
jgi:CRISPR system Cascade subunit CasA